MSNAAKIQELEAEIAKLKEADAKFAAMKPEHQLATVLHKLMCHHNHVDGCGWEYEGSHAGPDWNGHAHKWYLEKALVMLGFCRERGIAISDAVDLLQLAKEF